MSKDELLEALRFGADVIFRSKDQQITDEDIDLILERGTCVSVWFLTCCMQSLPAFLMPGDEVDSFKRWWLMHVFEPLSNRAEADGGDHGEAQGG